MTPNLKRMLAIAATVVATQAAAQVTFYEGEHFRGGAFRADRAVGNFDGTGFNDRASSAIVEHGRWEVCEDAGFQGRCTVLHPGDYPSLGPMGLNNRISSVRPVSGDARHPNEVPVPPPVTVYEYRRVPGEHLYEVPVTSVRAVLGQAEQRCWVERQQVVEPAPANVPGAIVGAVIGGVLGHQVGSGRGRDAATVGGAVVGGAVGANVGRGGSSSYTQDVQRCETVPGTARPAYWDVVYYFRGVEHRVQMSAAPGRTIWVNGIGEPRG
jgi:uncharacterized protein YcfJ